MINIIYMEGHRTNTKYFQGQSMESWGTYHCLGREDPRFHVVLCRVWPMQSIVGSNTEQEMTKQPEKK